MERLFTGQMDKIRLRILRLAGLVLVGIFLTLVDCRLTRGTETRAATGLALVAGGLGAEGRARRGQKQAAS